MSPQTSSQEYLRPVSYTYPTSADSAGAAAQGHGVLSEAGNTAKTVGWKCIISDCPRKEKTRDTRSVPRAAHLENHCLFYFCDVCHNDNMLTRNNILKELGCKRTKDTEDQHKSHLLKHLLKRGLVHYDEARMWPDLEDLIRHFACVHGKGMTNEQIRRKCKHWSYQENTFMICAAVNCTSIEVFKSPTALAKHLESHHREQSPTWSSELYARKMLKHETRLNAAWRASFPHTNISTLRWDKADIERLSFHIGSQDQDAADIVMILQKLAKNHEALEAEARLKELAAPQAHELIQYGAPRPSYPSRRTPFGTPVAESGQWETVGDLNVNGVNPFYFGRNYQLGGNINQSGFPSSN